MADETKRVLIDIGAKFDEGDLRKIVSTINDSYAEIPLKIDGKGATAELQKIMNQWSRGELLDKKVSLALDTSKYEKDLTRMRKLASIAGDEISEEIEKALDSMTSTRGITSLRQQFNKGRKDSFGKKGSQEKEFAEYQKAALKELESKRYNIGADVIDAGSEDRLYSYVRALKEYLTVLNDIQSESSKRNISIDLSKEISSITNELGDVYGAATSILPRIGRQGIDRISGEINKIKGEFAEIAGFLKTLENIKEIRSEYETMAQTISELQAEIAKGVGSGISEEAQREIDRLSERYENLLSALRESEEYNNKLFDEKLNLEVSLDTFKSEVSELSSALEELRRQYSALEKQAAEYKVDFEIEQDEKNHYHDRLRETQGSNAALRSEIEELERSLEECQGAAQNALTPEQFSEVLTVFTQLKDAVLDIQKAFGGIDGEGFTPLLSSIQRINELIEETAINIKNIPDSFNSKNYTSEIQQTEFDIQNIRKQIWDLRAAKTEIKSMLEQGLTQKHIAKDSSIIPILNGLSIKIPDFSYDGTLDLSTLTLTGESANNALLELDNSIDECKKDIILLETGLEQLYNYSEKTFNFTDIVQEIQIIINKMEELSSVGKQGLTIKDINGNDTGAISGEVSALEAVQNAVKGVTAAVDDKTTAFRAESDQVENSVNSELTNLGVLWGTLEDVGEAVKNVTDQVKRLNSSSTKGTGKKNKPFKAIPEAIEELKVIDLDSTIVDDLQDLANINWSNFSNIKVGNSFNNLIAGLKDLVSADLSHLSVLQGIDFSGLSNLQYAGKATNVLHQQISNYKNSQTSFIDETIKNLRSNGMSDSSQSIQNLLDIRRRLVETFSGSNIFSDTDLDATMASFTEEITQAVIGSGRIVDNIKDVKEAISAAETELKDFNTALKTRYDLQKKQLKQTLTNEEELLLERATKATRAFRKEYEESSGGDHAEAIEMSKAKQKDYIESFRKVIDANIAVAEDKLQNVTKNAFNKDALEEVEAQLKVLINLKEKYDGIDKPLIDSEDARVVGQVNEKMEELAKTLKVVRSRQKAPIFQQFSDLNDAESAMNRAKELIEEAAKASKSKITWGTPKDDYSKLRYTEVTKDGYVKEMELSWDAIERAIRRTTKSQTEYESALERFSKNVKGKLGQLLSYYSAVDIWQEAIRFFKEGIQAVVDIDSAMTSLRMTTDETAESYRNFQKQAGETAQRIGATTSDVISATADVTRTGYSMEEAPYMAESAVILKNVSEFESISDATDALIAMKQAYQDLDVMEIVDVTNLLGNTTSSSTDQIATGLQKAGSALKTAGNDFYESSALLVAGNSIVQNMDSVAAGIRTVSMRITGTTASELESLGEDAEGLVETTSKLNDLVKSLTAVNGKKGISLLDDNGSYRSTYEILLDIGKRYDEIVAADQRDGQARMNALVEALAGLFILAWVYRNIHHRTYLIAGNALEPYTTI